MTRRWPWLTAALAVLVAAGGVVLWQYVRGDETEVRPSPSPPRPVSPFTGEPGDVGRAVLAVKIDNAAAGRPQTGLDAADIVYVEPVEGGLSRLLAVFSSRLPERVGPVRSARESDLELLAQFGRPALAYSGTHPGLAARFKEGSQVDRGPSEVPGAYSREPSRPAPHNFYAQPEGLLVDASQVSRPRDVGFRFGDPPEGGRDVAERTVDYPAAEVGFTWSASQNRWLVALDGSPARTAGGTRLAAATVVVQRVTVRDSQFRDVSGNVTPYVETVGSGEALVLRNGKGYPASWSRPNPDGGTTFTDEAGERLRFARGPVWVVLVATDAG